MIWSIFGMRKKVPQINIVRLYEMAILFVYSFYIIIFCLLQRHMKNTQRIEELYSKSDALFLQLSAYFKKLIHDHQKANSYTVEQKKILKLFSYNVWQQYMRWVDQKLQQSQLNKEGRQILPEIAQQQAQLQDSIYTQISPTKMVRCQHLAIQNAKLRKQNIGMHDKIQKLQNELQTRNIYYRNSN